MQCLFDLKVLRAHPFGRLRELDNLTVGLTEMDYADVNWTERGKCWFLVLANLEFWLFY
jgi:hypothetical protein